MMWRLKEVPAFSSFPTQVEPIHFNQIRLALRRLSNPIRLELSNQRNVDMIIDNDSWVCVDRSMNDLPIVAWTDFETRDRNSLLAPVKCNLHYYHGAAGLIVRDALSITYRLLSEQLVGAEPNVR